MKERTIKKTFHVKIYKCDTCKADFETKQLCEQHELEHLRETCKHTAKTCRIVIVELGEVKIYLESKCNRCGLEHVVQVPTTNSIVAATLYAAMGGTL